MRVDMENITAAIYEPADWAAYANPPPDWPADWDYPEHPLIAHPEMDRWLNCYNCHRSCNGSCTCVANDILQHPIVEIAEYAAYAVGELNRGVRVLRPIRQGAVIGQYIGRLIPYDTQQDFGDTIYPMLILAPRYDNEMPGPVATMIAGRQGNWTKFINGATRPGQANVQFDRLPVGRLVMYAVIALRDIGFHEQLFVDYGDRYTL